jgi:putative transposase
MTRPLRIEYAGAHYHVMNRGNQGQTVFLGPEDYELFLGRLGRFSRQFEVQVLCYCCMPNHVHLYLCTQQANLSRFMQSLLTSFAVALNQHHENNGHVFQGRFKACLVENAAYGAEVSRYIHLNPVRTQALRDVGVRLRRKHLRDSPWSSYAACIGLARGPAWFDPAGLLRDWGDDRRARMRRYAQYVEEGLLRDLEDPQDQLAGQTILGTEAFVDRIRRAYLSTRSADRLASRALARAGKALSFDAVARCVADTAALDLESLLVRQRANSQWRRLLMYAACHYCRGAQSLTAFSRRFALSVGGLTMARDRVESAFRVDRKLRRAWSQLEQKLNVM